MHVLKQIAVVYKKAQHRGNGVIVTMLLPVGTRINRAPKSTKKNRADQALVLAVQSADGKKDHPTALPHMTGHQDGTEYRVGALVVPQLPFDTSSRECASGVHFFRRREDAVNYG